MDEPFQIDFKLFHKQIGISGKTNILKFYGIIIAFLVGIKYLTALPPNPFPLKELFALSIAFLGGFRIQTDKITNKQIKMMTFFPFVRTEKIKKYFLYKKPIVVYIMIFYLLFPINLSREEILSFFFFLSVIMFMMFIDTLSHRLFPNTEIPDRIYTFIRIAYFVIFASYLFIDIWGFDLKTFIMRQHLWYLILVSSFFTILNPFILTFPNRKENIDD